MIRLVAFDLDGTIGDTIPLCLAAFREATTPYVDHELSDDEIARTFGLNEEGMINQVVSGFYSVKTPIHTKLFQCNITTSYTFSRNKNYYYISFM